MSTETNKAICRQFLDEVLNQRRLDLIEEYVDENIVEYLGYMAEVSGIESVKAGLQMGFDTFPDYQLSVDDEIAEGDKVVFRWTLRGTHEGEYLGVPATGKKIEQIGAAIYRMANARIVELWFYPDNLGLLQQFGAIPTPEAA